MTAKELRDKINEVIEKYGESIDILNSGELMVCEDTGSEYRSLEVIEI
jgi:hypothetical protein